MYFIFNLDKGTCQPGHSTTTATKTTKSKAATTETTPEEKQKSRINLKIRSHVAVYWVEPDNSLKWYLGM